MDDAVRVALRAAVFFPLLLRGPQLNADAVLRADQAYTSADAELIAAVFALLTVRVLRGCEQNIAPRIKRYLFAVNLYALTDNIVTGANGDILTRANGGALRNSAVVCTLLRGRARRNRYLAFDDGVVRQRALRCGGASLSRSDRGQPRLSTI